MIKRILVALAPDEDTRVAERYAVELARRYDAEVTGLAVVDTHHIATRVGPGGAVGAMYYAETLRERLCEEARQTAHDLAVSFDTELEAKHVPHHGQIEDGNPVRRIVEDTKFHDLLVIARDTHFYYPRPFEHTHTLAEVVKHGLVPTLAVGAGYRPVQRVLVAFDGDAPAARTMQRFAQLQPFGRTLDVEVVHVRKSDSAPACDHSSELLHLAGAYLRAHGFAAVLEKSLEPAAPGVRILKYARENAFDLIVAGAHSVSAVKRLAFGSTTHALLEGCSVPLFLYH